MEYAPMTDETVWKQTVIGIKEKLSIRDEDKNVNADFTRDETFFLLMMGTSILSHTNQEEFNKVAADLEVEDGYAISLRFIEILDHRAELENVPDMENVLDFIKGVITMAAEFMLKTPKAELPLIRTVH